MSYKDEVGNLISFSPKAKVINFYAAFISANASNGVRITGLETGDVVRIDSIQHDAYFTKGDKNRNPIESFIQITQGIRKMDCS